MFITFEKIIQLEDEVDRAEKDRCQEECEGRGGVSSGIDISL